MGLKQLIKKQKILANAIDAELVLPGEPMIYSIKYSVGHRTHSIQFFRNAKWKSLLKCYFDAYYNTKTPVVVIVRFFVSPPGHVNISAKDLRKETIPAVHAYELCDYLLSFLEMLHHVLMNSYRQVVKIDAEKFYSSNPRTVMKFMKWSDYVYIKNKNTVHTKSESVGQDRQVWPLQPDMPKHATDENFRERSPEGQVSTADEGTVASGCPLQNSSTSKSSRKKKKDSEFVTSHEKA